MELLLDILGLSILSFMFHNLLFHIFHFIISLLRQYGKFPHICISLTNFLIWFVLIYCLIHSFEIKFIEHVFTEFLFYSFLHYLVFSHIFSTIYFVLNIFKQLFYNGFQIF